MRYLLDTNVVVDILRDNSSVTERYLYEQLHNGRLIEDNDIYIVAISMVNGCTLVTANANHFGRVEDLNFVNWRAA